MESLRKDTKGKGVEECCDNPISCSAPLDLLTHLPDKYCIPRRDDVAS